MAYLFGRKWTRKQLMERVGDVSQFAVARPCELTEGRAKGVATIDFSTGTGFRFTVVPGRAMDISAADYCGKSLCWRSPTGETNPQFYDERGLNWLRGFFGGLLTTCGLTHMGAPCTDQGQELGLHGRISHTPAEAVRLETGWDGDEYMMGVTGTVREVAPFMPCLSLTRSIFTFLGQSRLYIHDEVTNIGHEPAPHMILYHVNFGWPLVDEGSRVVAPTVRAEPRDARAADKGDKYWLVERPQAPYAEKVYWHKLADDRGSTMAGIINDKMRFGGYVAFDRKQLPCLVQWKMMNKGTYVVGLEPGTNITMGRATEREAGRLMLLAPGQTVKYDLELGALQDKEQCDAFESSAKKILGKRKK